MRKPSEQKTKISAGLSDRVVTAIQGEADRIGVSFADVLRRITDDWTDRLEASRVKPAERVVVLDRSSGRLLSAT